MCMCRWLGWPARFPVRQYEKLSKLTHSARIHFDSDELKAMVAALHFIFLNAAKYDVDSSPGGGAGVLPMELQQLGLPRDICNAIVRAFQQSKEALRDKLHKGVLSCTLGNAYTQRRDAAKGWLLAWRSLHPLVVAAAVSVCPRAVPRLQSLDWRVDYVMASSFLEHTDTSNIRLQLHVAQPGGSGESAAGPASDPLHPAFNPSAATNAIPPQLLSFSLTPAQFTLLYNDLKQAKQLFQHV